MTRMSNFRFERDGWPRFKPFAIWTNDGIGFWIMRSFHADLGVCQGVSPNAREAYAAWLEQLELLTKKVLNE
jgi:hypothetical protein